MICIGGLLNIHQYMANELLSNFGRRGVDHGLFTMQSDIEDTSYLSKYFVISEFNPIFTAGKNVISFNGSSLLYSNSEIQVQCIDSNGNSLYIESPKSKTQFSDVANFIVSIHIYNETYNGPGKLALVGKTIKGEIVRWMANISIDKTLQNISKTRLYNTPTIEARSLLYPVIDNTIASGLSKVITLTGSFNSYAVSPIKDTIQSYINPKKTAIDYRLVLNDPMVLSIGSHLFPTKSFNSQMEDQSISLVSTIIQDPFSYTEKSVNISSSFKIKKVIDNKTVILNDAFFYPYRDDQVITNINLGNFTSSYKWISYNTQSEVYKQYNHYPDPIIYTKESYAEIVYRNIKTFSGFIARHKVYRKSLVYSGDFQLIADEPLGTRDLLVDPVTTNKTYESIGTFYNQYHIGKYWCTSSNEIQLFHSVSPYINSMKISKSSSYDVFDGTKYLIAKIDPITASIVNDATYIPYDSEQFNKLSGSSYSSNFIDLKANSLYVLSMNLSIEKEEYNSNAKVSFYFTSSISSITKEKNYVSLNGLKLGEILVYDSVKVKTFQDKQMLFFTPLDDYYGTLVIIPYQCNITLSELTLGVYGDYGFSPDSLSTKIPFNVNVANEVYQIKAELYDINSTLIYSDLKTIQSFDINGESLYIIPTSIDTVPPAAIGKQRFTSWNANSPAEIYSSNLSDVSLVPTNNLGTVTSKDYINIGVMENGHVVNGRGINIHYNNTGIPEYSGRKIVILKDGTKTTYQ